MAEHLARALVDDPAASRLGVQVVESPDAVFRLDVEERHANFLGVTHGGVVHSLADVAMRLTGGPGRVVLDSHLALTGGSRPGDALTARVEEVTRGRTLGTYRVTITRGDGRVVGLLTGVTRAVGAGPAGSTL